SVRLHQELSYGERQSYQLEKRYLRKDGQIIWGHLTASLIRDHEGRPLYNIGMIEDITERKQTEESLRRNEAIRRAVLDAIPDFMFWTNQKGDFIPFNALSHTPGLEVGE